MATSKKATKKYTGKKNGKGRRRKKTIAAGDPIIITGGSMTVELNPDFDDDDAAPSTGHKKIKKIKHPTATKKIRAVEVTDLAGNQLLYFRVPPDEHGEEGKCIVNIKDR